MEETYQIRMAIPWPAISKDRYTLSEARQKCRVMAGEYQIVAAWASEDGKVIESWSGGSQVEVES